MTLVLARAALLLASAASIGSVQETALENTTWMLTSVSGHALDISKSGAELRLVSNQKRAYGFAGCNNFSAAYRLSRTALRFSEIDSTRKGCVDAALARLEAAYLAALPRVRSWRIQGKTLRFRNAAGLSLLTFEGTSAREDWEPSGDGENHR